jgi:RNA recognition motif-containing protein
MNLFVARLNPCTTTKDLQKLFEHYGGVTTVKVIIDKATGRSKCYGFVEMPDNHEAHEALKELDNTSFHENIISVKESMPINYRVSTMESGYRNRNSAALSSGNGDLKESNNAAWQKISQRDCSTSRNYGYRGSGFRYIR